MSYPPTRLNLFEASWEIEDKPEGDFELFRTNNVSYCPRRLDSAPIRYTAQVIVNGKSGDQDRDGSGQIRLWFCENDKQTIIIEKGLGIDPKRLTPIIYRTGFRGEFLHIGTEGLRLALDELFAQHETDCHEDAECPSVIKARDALYHGGEGTKQFNPESTLFTVVGIMLLIGFGIWAIFKPVGR